MEFPGNMTGSVIEQIFLEDRPLLDVRAPCEFKKGAFPNATNLPILNDQQREEVGICYKRHGQQQAIELGHRLIDPETRLAKISQWAAFVERHPNGFIYCFRGGKRSQFTQQWLKQNNIDYPLVTGGYKLMRTYLLEQLEQQSKALPLTLVSGKTGSGKTELLPMLPHHVDLEALANHRGSSFGGNLTAQPSSASFENSLSIDFLKLSSINPPTIYLEDEGKLIGSLSVPQTLRDRMLTLPCVLLTESIDTRIDISTRTYISELLKSYCNVHGTEDGIRYFINHHEHALKKITKRFGIHRTKTTAIAFNQGMEVYLNEGKFHGFRDYIESLLLQYYDPMYEYQFKKKNRTVLFSGNAAEITAWCEQQNIHK